MRRRYVIIIGIAVLVVALVIFVFAKRSGSNASRVDGYPVSASELLKKSSSLEASNDLLALRDTYSTFIKEFPNDSRIADVQKKKEDLNIRLIFSSVLIEGAFNYEVKPNDTLIKIAKTNNTTVELIKKSNNLKSDVIRPGMRLRILPSKFSIFVDNSQNILVLKKDEEIIKNYRVSTGKNNCTPTGTFKIVNKIVNPVWFKAGAIVPPESEENILGARWMGFDLSGYGIHGTTEPQSIGQQATQGCVRMLNQDVEELFTILPVGTVVVVED